MKCRQWNHTATGLYKRPLVITSPTFDELGLVGAPHVLQDAVVERLSQLCGHG